MTRGRARLPALEVKASARAGELRFRREPADLDARVEVRTNSGREARRGHLREVRRGHLREVRRGHLPRPVRASVTYADVTVSFRLAAWPDDPGWPGRL
ncbi:MAG TPA: hypothetical protein VFQ44_02880 [Streptosporangiaceae bacterium]|nr:hypothetical protein [Streptosporangiaceae bacterium]